ncbi:uncharacterized protein LOC120338895 [Styela clava]
MLKAAGYFSGIECPTEAGGEGCSRSYCPFRHQLPSKRAAPSTSAANVTNSSITIESVNDAIEKLKSDIGSGVGNGELSIDEYNPIINESYTPELYLSYNEHTSAANLYTPSVTSSKHSIDYCQETVMKSVLHGAKGASKKVKKIRPKYKSKNIYQLNSQQPITDMEYDPVVNYSTSTLENRKLSNAEKRNHPASEDVKISYKKSKIDKYSEFGIELNDEGADEDGLVINEDLEVNQEDEPLFESSDIKNSGESEYSFVSVVHESVYDDDSVFLESKKTYPNELNESDEILRKSISKRSKKLKVKNKKSTTDKTSKILKSGNKNVVGITSKCTIEKQNKNSTLKKKKIGGLGNKNDKMSPNMSKKDKDGVKSMKKKNGIVTSKNIDIATYIDRDEIKELEKDLENGDRYEECLRIFQEDSIEVEQSGGSCDSSANEQDSANTSIECTTKPETVEETSAATVGKRRVAHVNASISAVSLRKPLVPRKRISTPAQQMMERLKILEQEKTKETSTSSSRVAHKLSGQMASLAKNINSSVKPMTSLAKYEKKIEQNPWYPGKKEEPTVCGTATKGVSRVAHQSKDTIVTKNGNVIPSRPRIGVDRYSRVPTNIRQRYLTTFIDECLRIFNNNHEKAYAMAQMEEEQIKKRSNTKNIYLSLAASTLKKLREKPACEVKNITEQKNTETVSQKRISKKADRISQTSNEKSKRVMSHDRLLDTNTKKCKGGYTIEKREQKSKLTLSDLYETMCRYILTPEQLDQNGYPRPCDEPGKAEFKCDPPHKPFNNTSKKVCVHCGKEFFLDKKGNFAHEEECVHHWGRAYMTRVGRGWEKRYSCCQERIGSEGCTVGDSHVHADNKLDRSGYVRTLMKSPPSDGNAGIFTLDCEMSYTVNGLELIRVSVLDTNCELIYDTLVKPSGRVLDYNTRWSGITEDNMTNVKTTIRDVQAVFLSKFSADTILMGHSLESDLIALRIIHETVIDTSVVFPHKRGFPYKRALRTLCSEFLGLVIQNMAGEGHDSTEDASACMKLMLWKVEEDGKLSSSNK